MSGEIDRLTVGFAGDISDLESSYADAIRLAENFASSVSSIKPPSLAAPDLGGMGSMKSMGADVGSSIGQALAPLTQIAARLETSFDKVGGTIVTLARRLDDSMKFPAFDAFLTKVQDKLPDGFAKSSVRVIQQLNKVKTVLSSIGDVAGKSLSGLGMGSGVVGGFAKLATNITGIGPAAQMASKGVHQLKGSLLATLGVVSGVGSLVAFFGKGISGAADLGESVDKVRVVFGEAGSDIVKQGDEMARSFGMNKQEWIDGASALGMLGKSAGKSDKDATEFGNSMAKLAADLSSVQNIPLAEALQKIRSGLTGEAEPLRSLNIFLNENAVANEAVRLGISKTGKELTEGQKIQARASLITKQGSYALGNLAETAGSTKNQFRNFSGGVSNLATSIGTALLPAVDTVLGGLTSLTSGIGAFVERNKASFEGMGQWLSGAFKNFGEGISHIAGSVVTTTGDIAAGLGLTSGAAGEFGAKMTEWSGMVAEAWRNLPEYLTVVWLGMKEKAMNLGEFIGTIPANLQQLGEYVAGNWKALIVDAITAVGMAFKNLGINLFNLSSAVIKFFSDPTGGFEFNWTPMLDGFKKTAAKLPEQIKPVLTSLQGEIDAKLGQINGREADRAKKMAAAAAVKPAPSVAKTPTSQLADDGGKAAKSVKELGEWAKQATEKARTPLEKYADEVTKVNEALKAGLITDKQAGAIQKTAYGELTKDNKFAGSMEMNSKEAYSTILNAGGSKKGDGLAVVANAQETGNVQLREHTTLLKALVGKMVPEKVVGFK